MKTKSIKGYEASWTMVVICKQIKRCRFFAQRFELDGGSGNILDSLNSWLVAQVSDSDFKGISTQ